MLNQSAVKPRNFAHQRGVINVTNGTRFRILLIWLCVLTVIFAVQSYGQQIEKNDLASQWLTGKKLEQSSRLAVSGELNGGSLRQSLSEFGKRRQTAIFLDCRVDPTRELNLSLVDLTVEQFLWRVANACELGVCRVGDVYYVGPKKTAAVLPVLVGELKSKFSSRKLRGDGPNWRAKDELAWPQLSEPRQLIEQLAQQNQFVISNPESIPHDLWPAVDLPELALAERIAFLIVGFELWFEPTSTSGIKLVPFPSIDQGSRVVRNVKNAAKVARELREEFTSCKFSGRGNSLTITGPVDEMSQAVTWLVERQEVERGDPSLSRFSLDTTASRRGILQIIARQTGLQLAIEPELKQVLDQRVTIKLTQQPIETIIAEILKGTNARFQIGNGKLSLRRKK